MIHYKEYQPAAVELEAFENEQRAAKLITVDADGRPCVGTYPFLRSGEWLEIHLVTTDEQVGHLRQRPVAAFLIDEILSSVPSHWFGPEATHADQLHCTVQYDCDVEIIDDPVEIRRHLVDLLARYQPESVYVPLDHPEYAVYLRAICLLRLRTARVRAKFKLGQKLDSVGRETMMNHLRQRGNASDWRTITAMSGIDSRRK